MALTLMVGLACGPVGIGAQSGAGERVAAVAAAAEASPAAKAVNGGIALSAPADTTCRFTIYSITGQIIKSVDVTGTTVVEIQRGCYIIKCSSWLKKVIVR